jgi:hypothetical protein
MVSPSSTFAIDGSQRRRPIRGKRLVQSCPLRVKSRTPMSLEEALAAIESETRHLVHPDATVIAVADC